MDAFAAMRFFHLALVMGLLVAAGCSPTRDIRTAPPQPAISLIPDTTVAPDRASLVVSVEAGATALPADVQALRFRVAEIQLKPAGGPWTTYPSDVNAIAVGRGASGRKVVLATRVPPASYDSLGLVLADAFVQFDANAGGPLTLPRETPLRLPLTVPLAPGRRTALRLLFEPGASLSRDAACRWFFLPFFETVIE